MRNTKIKHENIKLFRADITLNGKNRRTAPENAIHDSIVNVDALQCKYSSNNFWIIEDEPQRCIVNAAYDNTFTLISPTN